MGGFLPDSRRFSVVVLGAAVLCVSAGASLAESQPGCLDCRAADEHVAFAAYYDLQSFEASLILNNKGPDVLPVQATVFSLRGERLDLGEWELEASSAVAVSLNEVLAPYPNRFRRGSLELRYRYDGCPLVLSAGLILEDRAAGVGFDEPLARPAGFASNRLEAVWWAPSSRARMELVVANRSEEIVTAAIAVRSLGAEAERRTLDVTLGPRETRVVNVPRAMTIGEFGRERWAAGSATVEHTGSPGDVAARGRIEDRAVRYATVVEFSDPEAGLGGELHGTGLRLGWFEGRALVPTLVVRNTAEEPSEVAVVLPWTDEWGEARTAELDPVVLEAGEVRELSRELLEQKYVLQLDFEGGKYVLGIDVLAPGQSLALDIAKARDDRVPDRLGNVIPPDAAGGQAHWSVIGVDAHAMIGRSEQVDFAHGISSTFACGNCCPHSYYSSWVDPGFANIGLHIPHPFPMHAYQMLKDCYGFLVGPFAVYGGGWSSTNVSVAVVVSTQNGFIGEVEPKLYGHVLIKVLVQVIIHYWAGPSMGCQTYTANAQPGGEVHILRLQITEGKGSSQSPVISATPLMPSITTKAQLLGWEGGSLTYNWEYKVRFDGDQGQFTERIFQGTSTGAGETSWNVPLAGQFYGGKVTITARVTVPNAEPSQYVNVMSEPYQITGAQPGSGAVKLYIDRAEVMPPSQYWFAKRIAKHETDSPPTSGGYAQFLGNGMPRHADNNDGGYGIFQLTPPTQDAQYWNWQKNIDGGKTKLDQARDASYPQGATAFWEQQVLQFNLWNADNPGNQKSPPPDTTEGDVVFSFSPSGSQKSYRDAIWIKAFNSATAHYISWKNTGGDANNPFWQFSKTNAQGVNYVNRICSTTP